MAVAGVGFLADVERKARLYANEPSVVVWTDQNIIDEIRSAFSEVVTDLHRISAVKPRGRVQIPIVADRREYILPPTIQSFLSFEKLDTDGKLEWEDFATHPLNPISQFRGYQIEGPILRLHQKWQEGETMTLTFVPNGEASIFEATVNATAPDWNAAGTTIKIPSSVVAGAVDTRENAYVGYMLRVLAVTSENGANIVQERPVIAHDNTRSGSYLGELTIAPALDPIPGTGASQTVTYEVLPALSYRLRHVIALKVARFISSVTGDVRRAQNIQTEITDKIRTLRLDQNQAEQRIGTVMQRRIRGNRRFGKTG